MSDRALVVASSEKGWHCGETAWHDDRIRPAASWHQGDTFVVPSFRSVVRGFDFARFEGIYRRSNGVWTAFLACWFAIEPWLQESVSDPRGDGALVAIRSARDAGALRTWLRAARDTVADAVRAGELSGADARERLLAGVRRRARGREVIAGCRSHE
ncbi:DUF6735 family protein [Halorhabdus rudnickae]|uniref:DUF6735 family protein n=1 Tax=Halorhabdus rudnickae TaxID=1775544 RepID=UPI00108230B5|nr:DUF6735 family protein [Halorhabdus rudnickae]